MVKSVDINATLHHKASIPLISNMGEEVSYGSVQIPKKEMFLRTQICFNWKFKRECQYGVECKFAHGPEQLNPRIRIQNYKSKPCVDLATGKGCQFKNKCSYAHPGDAIRAPQTRPYYDEEYFKMINDKYPDEKYPFGVFI
eukprot:GAHX01002530.1.p1 GENE.GAHX01002530.1~~GAHX01002530.1.p1  ORF type:complete len:141 (-),score=20.00 GAHX01002530.1:93-515(-)